MELSLARRLAIGWCLFMVVLLTLYQYVFNATGAPPVFLYLVFSGVWIFGAVMLYAWPTFGAAGTALYGVILGAQLLAAHGASTKNLLLALASFVGTALAVWVLAGLRGK